MKIYRVLQLWCLVSAQEVAETSTRDFSLRRMDENIWRFVCSAYVVFLLQTPFLKPFLSLLSCKNKLLETYYFYNIVKSAILSEECRREVVRNAGDPQRLHKHL